MVSPSCMVQMIVAHVRVQTVHKTLGSFAPKWVSWNVYSSRRGGMELNSTRRGSKFVREMDDLEQ